MTVLITIYNYVDDGLSVLMRLKLFIIINIIESTKSYVYLVSFFFFFGITSSQAVFIIVCQKWENIISLPIFRIQKASFDIFFSKMELVTLFKNGSILKVKLYNNHKKIIPQDYDYFYYICISFIFLRLKYSIWKYTWLTSNQDSPVHIFIY